MARLSHFLKPVRLRIIERLAPRNNTSLRILDVGCGNSSPSITKKWLGDVEYHGLDIQEYNNTSGDIEAIDSLFIVTPDDCMYESIPNDYYDVLILNHVIEHMEDPVIRIERLLTKLRKSGVIWLAFPSIKSASFPSAEGTLNFFDDETHIYMPSIPDVVNTLLSSGVRVHYAGPSHDIARWLIGVILLPYGLFKRIFFSRMCKGMWFIFGFETVIYGTKK